MAWAKNLYSRSQIDRAGETLRIGLTRENFINYLSAYDVMNNWRASHAFPLNTIQMGLRKRARLVDPQAEVVQRMKRATSIIQKLRRNDGMRLSRMQDLGGCRAILADMSHVYDVAQKYHESRNRHHLSGEKDYISDPRESGYRSYHLIYKYQSDRNEDYNNHRIEVQLRTRVQHAWATAVEVAGVFVNSPLKSSIGPSDWLEFFQFASSIFSIHEGTPRLHKYLDTDEIFKSFREIDRRINARTQLKNFTVAHGVVQKAKQREHTHFLLTLDLGTNQINIEPFSSVQLAAERYAEMERKFVEDPMVDVVLVAADSIESVSRAYPNYFADTSVFLELISQIVGDHE